MADRFGAAPTRPRVRWGRLLVSLVLVTAAQASAESAWVKDQLRLNLRSGPGLEFRIMGVVETGDPAEILDRGDGWTQVRVPDLGVGWIPAGYLQPEPPSRVRLEKLESENSGFREQLDALTERAGRLESQNRELAGRDEEQRTEIELLTRENLELRAGARWPEWITGAGILCAGMAMGAILHAAGGRRNRPRIRL